MDLTTAIAERRAQLDELEEESARVRLELEKLEEARELVAGVLAGRRMKPPPAARRKPVRAEKPAPAKAKRVVAAGLPAVVACETCRKPLPPRKPGTPGRAKRFHEECKPSRQPKEASAKAEEDPAVPAIATAVVVTPAPPPPAREGYEAELGRLADLPDDWVSCSSCGKRTRRPGGMCALCDPKGKVEKEQRRSKVIAEVRAAVAAVSSPVRVLSAEERARLLKESEKWRKQCSAVDARGQRCSLLHPHEGQDHNASGRAFKQAFSAGSALPRRELDERAFEGRAE